jgi:polyhydroxybutyrate depolymerase
MRSWGGFAKERLRRSLFFCNPMIKKIIFFSLIFFLGFAPLVFAAESQPCTMEFDGRLRGYLLHLPSPHKGDEPMALVVVLHGGGQDAWSAEEMTGFSELADQEGFVVVYPNGTGMFPRKLLTWNAGNFCGYAMDNDVDDAGFIAALLDRLKADLALDPKRIFVTGISNGGMLAYRLACLYSDRIAAIAPVAAAMNDEACMPRGPVSVIAFHGTADRRVLYNGGAPEVQWDAYGRKDKSVATAMNYWVARNGCAGKPWRTENRHFSIDTWEEGAGGTEVVLFTIKGGGHAWPGGKPWRFRMDEPTTDVVATKAMWDFFKAHPKE